MTTLLERYRKGQHEQVWSELLARGDKVRQEPLLSYALAIAHETMSRVKENIEQLISRLLELDYEFECPLSSSDPLDDVVYAPPRSDVPQRITELEHVAGLLPLSLRVWYEVVGTVNFKGTHPGWRRFDPDSELPNMYLDPIVVAPIEHALQWYYDDLTGDDETDKDLGFETIIAPDYYHKDHVSGGPPYSIYLPNPAVDAPLLYEWHETTFVNYLRLCFPWGGFPGFAWYADRPEQDLAYLRQGLLPI